ncbi:hypothetical protein JCM3774_001215 [Rhodotorula dairenensis]
MSTDMTIVAGGRPTLLSLSDELLSELGVYLSPELDDGIPSYGCLGVNRRLREIWRPFLCSRLRFLSVHSASCGLVPTILRFVSSADIVRDVQVVFAATGLAREIAAVSIFRNIKMLLEHLSTLEHLALIEPTAVVYELACLLPAKNTRLRSMRLQIRHRKAGRILSVPQVKSLELQVGRKKEDIPFDLPWHTLETLRIESDAMSNSALCELRDQLNHATQDKTRQLPLKRLSVNSSSYESGTRQHVAAGWFAIHILKTVCDGNLIDLELRMKILPERAIDILPSTSVPSLYTLTLDIDCTLFDQAYFEHMPDLLRLFPNLRRLLVRSHDTRCLSADALKRVRLGRYHLARQHRSISDLLALLRDSNVLDFRSWYSLRGDSYVRWTRSSPSEDFTSDVWYATTTV